MAKKTLDDKLADLDSERLKLIEEKARNLAREQLITNRLNAKKAAENRKALSSAKHAFGGLCEIAGLIRKDDQGGLICADKGVVLGAMLWVAESIANSSDKISGLKARGDKLLAEREQERVGKKALAAKRAADKKAGALI